MKRRPGKPKGPPRGLRNNAPILAELFENEAEEILCKIIKKAKRGDGTCLRLYLDRVVPPRRDRPVHFTMAALKTPDDASKAMAAITAAMASGELTPREAGELARVVEVFVRVFETTEIESRLKTLEERAIHGLGE